MQGRLEELASLLSRAGARVESATPDVDLDAYFLDYARLLQVMVSQAMPREERERRAAKMRESADAVATAEADAPVIVFPMLAIFSGLPSTAFPAGLDGQGLPLGLQAIGPYLEDRTTLRFAQLLEREWHRFEAPPRYR